MNMEHPHYQLSSQPPVLTHPSMQLAVLQNQHPTILTHHDCQQIQHFHQIQSASQRPQVPHQPGGMEISQQGVAPHQVQVVAQSQAQGVPPLQIHGSGPRAAFYTPNSSIYPMDLVHQVSH